MRARILPAGEWSRINAPHLPELLEYMDPHNIAVCVVEKDEEIAASVFALRATHFEGLWIEPKHRGNAGVFRALIRQAYAVPRHRRERFVLADSENGDARMEKLCPRLGGKALDRTFYLMPVGV